MGNNIKEPVSFQQPFSSTTQKISSPEIIDRQQGFPLQQDGITSPQQGFPPQQQGPSPQQQDILQQPPQQGLSPQQKGFPPEQQGIPLQQQGLFQQQQGLSQQQPQGLFQQQELSQQQPQGLSQQQQGLSTQLLDNVEKQSVLPDHQVLLPQQPVLSLAQEVISNYQIFSLQQPQLHPEEIFPTSQPAELSPESSLHMSAVTSDVNINTSLVVTISDQSSDSMMQSLVYSNTASITSSSSSSCSSVPMVPIVNSEDSTPYTSSAIEITSLYGIAQSVGQIQTTQSNSLDQLNPFG